MVGVPEFGESATAGQRALIGGDERTLPGVVLCGNIIFRD
jgi:hypothetical protein